MALDSAYAVTVTPKNPAIGQSIFITDPVADHYYSVFSVSIDGPKSDPCAYISGYELLDDNDLTDYGTCFINKSGTFQVLELLDDFFANYNDSLQSAVYLSKDQVNVRKAFLFSFNLSYLNKKQVISTVSWQPVSQATASVSLESYLSLW
jgi:hypothetical protein